ncbi:MAG: type II toxin-antitoxin system RelE/ParE family toxin [Gracilibacteraceae bacterium]|jgi:plasmid stabilization system protein ParE|nr:type II toxin-antitoxin system RelE/ParE family toxin [Gracilibacteraceae bacterium]
MRYKVLLLPQANRDIASLADALASYPSKAKRIFQEIERKLDALKDNPLAWPVYHANPKYRRMLLEGHALFYIVDEDMHEAKVYRVIYAKRDIPRLL